MPDLGLLLIISGPSGVGKTTLTHHVERELGGIFSVSMTTRPKSHKDVQGCDYFFVDEQEFQRRRDAGELLEWARVFGNFYGTPRKPVEQALSDGQLFILEIDVEGAVQVKDKMPESLGIFVMPPSEAELLARLRLRGREDESVIQHRFAKAKAEIARAKASGIYDAFIVNDNLASAVDQSVAIVRRHRHREP